MIKYLSDEQVSRFFKAMEAEKDPVKRARDLCCFHLMLSYGLRALEVKLLQVKDVDLEVRPARIWITRVKEKHVKTDAKTGEKVWIEKPRRGDRYRLSPANEARVRAWLKARRKLPYAEESPFLFLTRQAGTISTNSLNRLTHKYGAKAGMPALHPHQFRHTCGVRLARDSQNAFDIAKRLGHASVQSTQCYIELAGPEREEQDRRADAAIEGED